MLLTATSAVLAPKTRIERASRALLAPKVWDCGSWVGRADKHGRGRRCRVGRGQGHLALYRRDADVVQGQAQRDAQLLQHLPRLAERLLQRDRRPQELDAALEVRVAALLLGGGGGRQHPAGAIPLRPRQVVP